MNGQVKFAIVGCGNIGSRHVAVVNAQEQASISALCDVEEEKLKSLTAKYGPIPCFTSFDELLENTDADVVNICTPHGLHAPMAIAAANKGKHVLVEKPMALTTREADDMIAAGEKNRVRIMVVKQNRYNVPIGLAKKALDSGKMGKTYMVICNVLWNRHEGYYRDSNWRGRKALEGGALYTQVSHFLDLMIWWFGDVVQASSQIATLSHNIEIEDNGTARLVFESGVLGSLSWSTSVYNKNYEGSITILGENGTIKIGGQYLNKVEFWDVQSLPLPEDVVFVDKPNFYGNYQGTSSNHDKVINEVVADLLFERHNTVEGDEGRKTIQAIEMIYANQEGIRK
ncbi:MAG: Gfo/Idh/MocA family oxidoreductase [Leptolinea sp.]|jgi:predicted dehydrogenase|nr:Gfo/Idh/MocA family oxidoreductase [Leptolinea sp.]